MLFGFIAKRKYNAEIRGSERDMDMKVVQKIEPSAASSQNDTEEMSRYGIRKVSIEYFYLGMYGYRYLKDAVAQAKLEVETGVKRKA